MSAAAAPAVSSAVAWVAVIATVAVLRVVSGQFRRSTLWAVEAALVAGGAYLLSRAGYDRASSDGRDVAHAFVRGGDATFSALLRPLFPGHAGPVPGSYGWMTVVGAALAVFVLVDRRSARREVPSVSVDQTGGGGDSALAQLISEVQFRLPAVDVKRPSAIPGGQALDSLASIVESSHVTGSGPIAAAMGLLRVLYAPPPTFLVRLYVEPEPGAGSLVVTVDLRDAGTNQTRRVHTLAACSSTEAAERVAAYVARQVLAADPTAPRWSGGPADGADLALALLRGQQPPAGSYDTVIRQRREQRQRLHAVVGMFPRPALAIYELASLCDLDAEHLGALRLHLINREHHEEFRRGRYRLAMSMCMVASDALVGEWTSPDRLVTSMQVRADIAALLPRSGVLEAHRPFRRRRGRPAPSGASLADAVGAPVPTEAQVHQIRTTLLDLAAEEFDQRRRGLARHRLVIDALVHRHRRSELLAYLRTAEGRQRRRGDRQSTLIGAAIARTRKAALCGQVVADPGLVGRILGDPHPRPHRRPSWQTLYNAACFHAISLADTSAAVDHERRAAEVVDLLRRAVGDARCELVRPSEWIGKDPDFCALRDTVAFGTFVGELVDRDFGPTVAHPPADDPSWFARVVAQRAALADAQRDAARIIDVTDVMVTYRPVVAAPPDPGPGAGDPVGETR